MNTQSIYIRMPIFTNMEILVVEDDQRVAELIQRGLILDSLNFIQYI